MDEKKPPEKLEEIEVTENFCGLLKQKKQKEKCVQFYEEAAGLLSGKKILIKNKEV